MKNCLIIAGGCYSDICRQTPYDYVIACDAGVLFARQMGINPDLILGDFDSLSAPVPAEYEGVPVMRYPAMKDDSDTMLAVKAALQKGFDKITLTCALGGRLDHTYANLQTLAYIAQNGHIGELLSDDTHILTFAGGSITLPQKEGYTLSLFSHTDCCRDVSITGSLYDVACIDLRNTVPLGLSNAWRDEAITISMKEGILLIIMSRLETPETNHVY